MEMSKSEGIKMLKILDFPTIEQVDSNLLDENSQVLKEGLSVRTSPRKQKENNNVYLPSIHNCSDIDELRDFIKEHNGEYEIIVHKTVKPQQIGSVSRYGDFVGNEKLVVEIFEDFEKRKDGIIKNRVILPIVGERFAVSQLQMQEENPEEFNMFSKVIKNMKYMPFRRFDAEFVIEEGKILYTDLTIQSKQDSEYAEELKRKIQLREEERRNKEGLNRE